MQNAILVAMSLNLTATLLRLKPLCLIQIGLWWMVASSDVQSRTRMASAPHPVCLRLGMQLPEQMDTNRGGAQKNSAKSSH